MTATYCIQTHVYCPAAGAPILTVQGANRDTAHPAVVANPGLFSATALPVAGVNVSPSTAQYLAAHKGGPEL